MVCPPDTGARTPESWWYLAATSPRPRPRWHLLRWRGRHCHLPRQPGEVRGRLPPSRSLERGRCGGEQAGHQNTAGASQPPAGGKLSELSTGIGEAFTRIRSMTAPDIWKNIPSKSDVYCVQKSPFPFYSIWNLRGQILILASTGQVDDKDRHREHFLSPKAKFKLVKQAWGSRLQARCQPGGPIRWRGWTPRDSNRDHSRCELHVDLFVDQFPQGGGLGFRARRNFWALRTRWVTAQIQTTNLDTQSSFNSKMVKRFWSNIAGSF